MQYLPLLVIGGVVGAVFGYLMSYLSKKNEIADWEKRLGEARDRLEVAKRDAGADVDKERTRAREAERKASEAGERVAALEKALEHTKSQLRQAEADLQEAEAARAKAVAQVDAGATGRQQAETRCKQAEATALQAQMSLEEAQAGLSSAREEIATLKESADRRTKEVQRLRSDVASFKRGSDSGLEESVEVFAGSDGSLEGILATLMDAEGQKAAVLADANGIIVSAAGEPSLREGMAATSQLVGSMCTQLVGMVPFSSVRSYCLQDTQSNVIAGRAFVCAGETIGLATYGQRIPSDRILDGAMASLSAALD
jgi:myosin heavy subunit